MYRGVMTRQEAPGPADVTGKFNHFQLIPRPSADLLEAEQEYRNISAVLSRFFPWFHDIVSE